MNLLIDLDELKAELSAIEAESIGWIALGKDAYLHVGKPDVKQKDTHFVLHKIPSV